MSSSQPAGQAFPTAVGFLLNSALPPLPGSPEGPSLTWPGQLPAHGPGKTGVGGVGQGAGTAVTTL